LGGFFARKNQHGAKNGYNKKYLFHGMGIKRFIYITTQVSEQF
jgi:hypothetical protein